MCTQRLRVARDKGLKMLSDKWGFVDDARNVYLRSNGANVLIGNYPDGTPQEALIHYRRKYDAVRKRVEIILTRTLVLYAQPRQIEEQICGLEEEIASPKFLGDITVLRDKLTLARKNLEEAQRNLAERQKKVYEDNYELVAKLEALVNEKNKNGAQRNREAKAILKKWYELEKPKHAGSLHKRMKVAKMELQKDLDNYFKDQRAKNDRVVQQKRSIIQKAKSIKRTTDAYARYKTLLNEWKSLPKVPRSQENELWQNFRTATAELVDRHEKSLIEIQEKQNAAFEEKVKLLEKGRSILSIDDCRKARREYLVLVDKWEKIGSVPKDKTKSLEDDLRKLDLAIRKKENEAWEKNDTEKNLRSRLLLDQLEAKLLSLENSLKVETNTVNSEKIKNEIGKTKSFIDIIK
ncbi:hypothetical protein TW391 [Tropheryma whipplei TW08/27]|nr:hypothetical protein TW391 [Tropheryma whipplei TW08/27]